MTQTSFLDTIGLELENVNMTEIPDPPREVERGDHLVGVASDEHRKLYHLWQQYEKAGLEAGIQARYASNTEEREKAVTRSGELSFKAGVIRELFWVCVRDSFGLWEKSVGLRKGWQVVWFDPEPQNPLIDLLRGRLDPDG